MFCVEPSEVFSRRFEDQGIVQNLAQKRLFLSDVRERNIPSFEAGYMRFYCKKPKIASPWPECVDHFRPENFGEHVKLRHARHVCSVVRPDIWLNEDLGGGGMEMCVNQNHS